MTTPLLIPLESIIASQVKKCWPRGGVKPEMRERFTELERDVKMDKTSHVERKKGSETET